MKYFHNPQANNVHAYDDDALAHFIPSHLVPMSEQEAQAYINSATASLPATQGSERNWRDTELASLMWLRERHRDQLEIEATTTLTAVQFKELLVYLQALRDWPQSSDFPDTQYRPVAPSWAAEQTE